MVQITKRKLDGVIGIIIWTQDLDRLSRFYRDVLGLSPHSVHEDFVTFDFGGMRLNLGYHDQVEGPSKEPYRIMINLGTSDVHSFTEDLRAKGVPIIRPPEKEHWGGYVATFQDPDGNTLQLLQLPD